MRYLPVEHEGNRRSSVEEAERVRSAIEEMLGGAYTDSQGRTRPLRVDDFMVVAPYNAQVACLRAAVPEGVPVGTVDKFQGQEAPVVFFSMASSSGEDVPRNMEFLFSRNRLNVAVSRRSAWRSSSRARSCSTSAAAPWSRCVSRTRCARWSNAPSPRSVRPARRA